MSPCAGLESLSGVFCDAFTTVPEPDIYTRLVIISFSMTFKTNGSWEKVDTLRDTFYGLFIGNSFHLFQLEDTLEFIQKH